MFTKRTYISVASALLLALTTATSSLAVEQGTENPNCLFLTNNLTVGSTDTTTNGEVTLLQEFLISKDVLKVKEGTALGTFGSQTKSAVSAFQRANGIIATGYVGPLTRANIETLTCAIGANDSSMLPVSVIASDALPLVTFTSPINGALLIKGEKDIDVDWTLTSGVIESFPATSTYIVFSLVNASSSVVGTINGKGLKLSRSGKNNTIEKNFAHILKGKRNVIPDGQYKIVATLRYATSSYSVSESALAVLANRYAAQSPWFTVVSPAPKSVIKLSASKEEIQSGQSTTLTWTVTPSSSVCTFTDVTSSTSLPVLTSGTLTVTPEVTNTYAVSCELTSEWPLPGMSYTTSIQKRTTITVIPDKKAKKCNRNNDSKCNTLYTCNGVVSREPCADPVTINSILPSPARVGERVTVTGTGFAPEGNTIYIDGYSASALYNYVAASGIRKSGNSLDFILPSTLLPECGGSGSNSPVTGCPAPKAVDPGTHTLIVKNASGVSSASSFVVTTQMTMPVVGVSMIYLAGNTNPNITANDVTRTAALDSCMNNKANNPNDSIRCTWNGVEIYSYIPTVTAPRQMRCSNASITGLSTGSVACYGIWDSGESLGGDSDICGSYSYAGINCVVTTPACTSGQAIATAVYTPFTAPSSMLQTFAANLNTTPANLQQNLVRLWEYTCK